MAHSPDSECQHDWQFAFIRFTNDENVLRAYFDCHQCEGIKSVGMKTSNVAKLMLEHFIKVSS